MRKIKATVIGLNSAVKPPRQVPVEVEGYEVEPGWIVHRKLNYALEQTRGGRWVVSHIMTGRALIHGVKTRADAIAIFCRKMKDPKVQAAVERAEALHRPRR